jgi:hypothetical protein
MSLHKTASGMCFCIVLLSACSKVDNELAVAQAKIETSQTKENICLYFRDYALGGKGFMDIQYTAMITLHKDKKFIVVNQFSIQ